MATVGLGLGIVCLAQLDGRQVVGIGPCAFVGDHFPPDADIFYRFNPGDIFQCARLIQVKGNAGSQYITGVIADDHRTPWRNARSLQVSLIALGIRRQPRLEDEVLVIQVQVHARVIHQSGLMQVDVKTIVAFHLQGCLYACRGERGL